MDKDCLTLKRATRLTPSGELKHDDYDVLADSVVVGRIFKTAASPVGKPWMWTVLLGYHEDRTGYEPTREAAMAAFAKSWRRQWARAALGVAAGAISGALGADSSEGAEERAGGLPSASRSLPGTDFGEAVISNRPYLRRLPAPTLPTKGCIQNSDFAAAFAASISGLG
jgi:hypothetical protein